MSVNEVANLETLLSANPYPGRGIVLGRQPGDGEAELPAHAFENGGTGDQAKTELVRVEARSEGQHRLQSDLRADSGGIPQ